MTCPRHVLLLLAATTAAAPGAAQSLQNVVLRNSFAPSGAGARGLGMGGAFIAVADDGTAASFNPAGLSQLRRSELALVYFYRDVGSAIELGRDRLAGPDEHAKNQAPEFASLALPFEIGERRLTVQLSYQHAVDLVGRGRESVTFPQPTAAGDAPGEYLVDLQSDQSGALHTVSLAAGMEVAGPLSLGLSVNLWKGDWRASGLETARLRLPPGAQRAAGFPDLDQRFVHDQGLRALSLNLGLLLQGSHLRIGGVLRLPFHGAYRLDEVDDLVFDPGGPGRENASQRFRMQSRLAWPRAAGLGVALRPIRRLTLAADVLHTEWSQTVLDNVPNGALLTAPVVDERGNIVADVYLDRNFFDLFPASQSGTADSVDWHAGAEYLITLPRLVIPLRAGYLQERSPVPDLGSLRGRRTSGFTLGVGLNFDRIVVDVAYERRRASGAVGAALSGDFTRSLSTYATEQVTSDRLVGALIVRLGKSGGEDPLVRVLKRIFS